MDKDIGDRLDRENRVSLWSPSEGYPMYPMGGIRENGDLAVLRIDSEGCVILSDADIDRITARILEALENA